MNAVLTVFLIQLIKYRIFDNSLIFDMSRQIDSALFDSITYTRLFYFILCEEIAREYMMDGIEYKLDQTDGELFGAGPTNFDKRNCVYVIAIMGDKGPPIYKIGKTNDLNRRYREQWYSIPNFK